MAPDRILKADAIGYRVHSRQLIQDITLIFFPGILYGILGPNGSGKTTLLKALTGIWKPTSGKVYWQNQDLLTEDRHIISKTISLVPQHVHTPFEYSVEDIVSMGRYPHGRRCKEKDLIGILEMVDAVHLRNRRISETSHGERQRIYIARALMTESPVLLLDEPTANLDICHQLSIWQLLKDLQKSGKTIIVTSHDLIATERYCDKVAVLDQGRCVTSGTYRDVMKAEILRDVFDVMEGDPIFTKQFVCKH